MQNSLSKRSQVSFSEIKKEIRVCGKVASSKENNVPAEIAAARFPIIFTNIKNTA